MSRSSHTATFATIQLNSTGNYGCRCQTPPAFHLVYQNHFMTVLINMQQLTNTRRKYFPSAKAAKNAVAFQSCVRLTTVTSHMLSDVGTEMPTTMMYKSQIILYYIAFTYTWKELQ